MKILYTFTLMFFLQLNGSDGYNPRPDVLNMQVVEVRCYGAKRVSFTLKPEKFNQFEEQMSQGNQYFKDLQENNTMPKSLAELKQASEYKKLPEFAKEAVVYNFWLKFNTQSELCVPLDELQTNIIFILRMQHISY